MRGKFIVIEGTDCSGKETQSRLVVKKLTELGHKAVYLSFPMYDTPTGRIVGGAYLGKEDIEPSYFKEGATHVDPKVAALYYAADRKYNIHKILDYVNDGYYVIVDRYTSSNMAHQGAKVLDKDERFNTIHWIDKLEYWLLDLPKPDQTIFLHVPFEYSKKLKKNREFLDDAEKDEEHLKNAELTYIELSQLYNWDRIECVSFDKLKTIEEINEEVISHILMRNKNGS